MNVPSPKPSDFAVLVVLEVMLSVADALLAAAGAIVPVAVGLLIVLIVIR